MKYSDLRKLAYQSVVNPRKAKGLIKVLVDVNKSEYWVTRAKELLTEAETFSSNTKRYDENLQLAVTLLLLARCKNNEESSTGSKKT